MYVRICNDMHSYVHHRLDDIICDCYCNVTVCLSLMFLLTEECLQWIAVLQGAMASFKVQYMCACVPTYVHVWIDVLYVHMLTICVCMYTCTSSKFYMYVCTYVRNTYILYKAYSVTSPLWNHWDLSVFYVLITEVFQIEDHFIHYCTTPGHRMVSLM